VKACVGMLLLLFSFSASMSQDTLDVNAELRFYDYLLSHGLIQDAALQYEFISPHALTAEQTDSLNYLTGWNLYERKLLDSSAAFLLHVSPGSDYYLKSRMFAAYDYSYTGNTDTALYILNNLSVDSSAAKVIRLQKAGIALLQDDHEKFSRESKDFDGSYFATSAEENQLKKYDLQLKEMKSKSPLLAAGLSAVLPGAGKIYAGKRAEGIISFVQVAAFGLVAWENYHKAGVESARFIVSASVFSLFYIGNIWGSYFSVSIKKNERRNEIKQAILFNMHIPLRNVYR
jgi:hypothetical protein